MIKGRESLAATLKREYDNIDKLFKDQLIKTKVS
jgi:hypothetical protein